MASKLGEFKFEHLFFIFVSLAFILIAIVIYYSIHLNPQILYISLFIMLFLLTISWVFISTQKVRQEIQLLKNNQNNIFNQVESSIQIHKLINPNLTLPSTRNWVASPDYIAIVLNYILLNKPKQIVEFGAGVSSIYIANLIQHHNLKCTLTSVEHDEEYLKIIQKKINQYNLTQIITLLHCPLNKDTLSYKLTNFPINSIDMLLIDGPPTDINPNARDSTFLELETKLNPKAFIIADDTHRAEGKNMISKWLLNKHITVLEEINTEKGTTILQYTP